jgi:anti-sigma regulatory factor (Ser/Thr protein kinase)
MRQAMPSDRRRFNGHPDQVLLARQFVVSALAEDSPIREMARLLVSEVATNAVRHTASGTAEGGFRVSYELRDDRLRVEVYDAGSLTTPQRRAHDLEAPGGRGLELLDALASRWGTLGGPEGRGSGSSWISASAEAAGVTHPVLNLTADSWTAASTIPPW